MDAVRDRFEKLKGVIINRRTSQGNEDVSHMYPWPPSPGQVVSATTSGAHEEENDQLRDGLSDPRWFSWPLPGTALEDGTSTTCFLELNAVHPQNNAYILLIYFVLYANLNTNTTHLPAVLVGLAFWVPRSNKLYLFIIATTPNFLKFGDLEQHNSIFLHFLRSDNWNQFY